MSTTLSYFTLTRDSVGNIKQATTSVGTRSIAYDANYQIIAQTNPEAPSAMQTESFSYDPNYNRTSSQAGAYTYDSKSQRLTEDYRYFYHYDNNGNLTQKQAKAGFPASEVTNYTYSSENQLTAFKIYNAGSNAPSKEVLYIYDALGRRIQKQVIDHSAPSDPTKTFIRSYVYDGQNILREYDGNGNALAGYTHSGLAADDVLSINVTSAGVIAGLAQNSGSFMYLKDQLGSIADVTDSNGKKIQHYIYSAFGELLGIQDAQAKDVSSSPPLRTSYAFAGREFDSESGYYYNRARFYDPGTGRFLQRDPSPGKLQIPITVVNAYAYAGNNPIMYKDPSGAIFGIDDLIILTIIAVGVATAGMNVSEALKNPNTTFWQAVGVGVTGFITGSLSAAVGFVNPFLGIAASGVLSSANNYFNQGIMYGFDNVSWQRVGDAGIAGLAAGVAGAGSAFAGASLGLAANSAIKFWNTAGTGAGFVLGTSADSGISPCGGYHQGIQVCTTIPATPNSN